MQISKETDESMKLVELTYIGGKINETEANIREEIHTTMELHIS